MTAHNMIFFFYGPNTFAARQQIAKLASEYIKKTGSNLGHERINGAKVTYQELSSSLQASPFLAASRLVVVEDLAINKALHPKVADLTAAIPSTTIAVFYDPAVDQRTSYFKHMFKVAKTVKFEPLATAQLHRWIQQEVVRLDAEIEGGAISGLLARAGEDQWRLQNELTKLAGAKTHITAELINELVVANQNETIFDLVEAMSSGRTGRALEIYGQLRAEQMGEIHILSMVIWQLRNLLFAKVAGNMTSTELAKKAGMSPYVAGKMQTKQRNIHEDIIKNAFLQAVDTDYRIKSGQGAADALVEQLIYQVSMSVSAKS